MFDEYTRQLVQEIADDVSETRRVALHWDARIRELEALVDAVRIVVDSEGGCASGVWRDGEAFLAMADALDAYDEVRSGRSG